MSTSNRSIKWIENLADQELLIKAGEKVSIDIFATKDEVLAIETSTYLRDLLYHFEYLVRLFNVRVSQTGLELKLNRLEGSHGFTVSRNFMRLTVMRPQPGVVSLQCDKVTVIDNRTQKTSVMFSGIAEAKFGTFHDVEWYFLGSRVSAEQVARHYLTEFIQVTRSNSEN